MVLHVSLGCCLFYGGGSVVNSLYIAALIVCGVLCLAFALLVCYTIHCVISSAANILTGKRERAGCFGLNCHLYVLCDSSLQSVG